MSGPWAATFTPCCEDDGAVHTLLIVLMALVIAAACLGVLIAGVATARMSAGRRRSDAFRPEAMPAALQETNGMPAGVAIVVLDVDPRNRNDPALERLVEETAAQVFRSHPDAESV